MHPSGVGVGDGLQRLVVDSPGIPFEVVAKDIFLLCHELGQLHIGEYIARHSLTPCVAEGHLPNQRIRILGHKERKLGSKPVLFGGEYGVARMVGRLAAIHLRLTGAEGGRPHGTARHSDIHIKARRVDGQIVEAVAGDAKQHRRQPPGHAAARLGYECVHSAVR